MLKLSRGAISRNISCLNRRQANSNICASCLFVQMECSFWNLEILWNLNVTQKSVTFKITLRGWLNRYFQNERLINTSLINQNIKYKMFYPKLFEIWITLKQNQHFIYNWLTLHVHTRANVNYVQSIITILDSQAVNDTIYKRLVTAL